MNQKAHTGNKCCLTTDEESDDEQEHEYVAVPKEWVESVESRFEELEAENKELREQVAENTSNIEDHDSRLDEIETKQAGFGKAISSNQDRIEDVEDRFEDETPRVEAEKSGSSDLYRPETPLEQITNLPEHVATKELTENQERARFIAKDIQDYADMRLGEYVVSSKDIRKVLAAKEGRTIHWQTVSRVVEFLEQLGGDDVRVKDKHGTIVCFDPEVAKRYGNQQLTPVVSGATGKV